MSQPVHITNIFAEQTRYSVDVVTLKSQIESNLTYLKSIQSQTAGQLDGWSAEELAIVIASHEQQLAQLNEDLLINKII